MVLSFDTPIRIEISVPNTSTAWGKTWKNVILIMRDSTHPLETLRDINILNQNKKITNLWKYKQYKQGGKENVRFEKRK